MRGILKAGYRFFWLLFSLFPIKKNKVIFQSFSGRGFSDNPKYIAKKLLEAAPNLEIYWAANDKATASLPSGIHFVKYKTISYLYHMATARVWVDNIRKPFFIKRKNQYYIQTWHGGLGLKKVEQDAADKLDPKYLKWAKKDAANCDLMLSCCKTLTSDYRRAFWFDHGEIIEKGLPRNDILFSTTNEEKEKIKNSLGIDRKEKVLLYAPTFRETGDLSPYNINYAACVKALEKRFGGKWKVLVKLHPSLLNVADRLDLDAEYIINASHYNDIQELYTITDFIITDYSSVVFDFMITNRPAFLYAADLEEYAKERDYYFDLTKLPFPLSQTNDELLEKILNFNQDEYLKELTAFKEYHGFCDTGHASEHAANWIIDKCK